MGKALLVLEKMPESCELCPFFQNIYCDMVCKANNRTIDYPYPKDFKQNWCPLIPMPEKPDYPPISKCSHVAGWNDCIDAIYTESEKENKGVITHKCRMNTCSTGHSGNT